MKLYQYKQLAWLDDNQKIRLSQLPDSIVGQLTFGGVLNLDPNTDELEGFLTQNAQDKFGVSTSGHRAYWQNDPSELYNIADMILGAGRLAVGIYFIIGQNEQSHATITDLSYNFKVGSMDNTISITTGDWVIVNVVNGTTSAQIVKVDNTDAVSSVNGKVGVVNVYGNDIQMSSSDTTTIANKIASGVENVKEQNAGGQLQFWVGTQSEYDDITTKSNNTMYVIIE